MFAIASYLLLAFCLIASADAFTLRVCGNYCGPGWCNNSYISEHICDDSVEPESGVFSGYSCGDQCCRTHDICCGHGSNTSQCNSVIIECLHNCHDEDPSCTLDSDPIFVEAIKETMEIIEDWCSGEPCNSTTIPAKRATIAGVD